MDYTNKRRNIIISVILILAILLVAISLFFLISASKKEIDVTNALHGVVNMNDTEFVYGRNRKINLSKGDRVYIIEDDLLNKKYKVKYGEEVGTVDKSNVSVFEWDDKEKFSLMLDVSSFNMGDNFETAKDFESFILENSINYVYIRIGGRGWGKNGNFYLDDDASSYVDSCEYLGVPYGFYYLDEALDDEEIQEEVNFVKEFLEKNKTSMNVLPLVIDLEYQEGQGRADNIWEKRVPILNKLMQEFEKENIKSFIYANGIRANKYLIDVSCDLWIAMYPEEGIIPESFYPETIEISQLKKLMKLLLDEDNTLKEDLDTDKEYKSVYKTEFFDKVIGWQFTANGAKRDKISEEVDLSIVRNDFFKKYVQEKVENN